MEKPARRIKGPLKVIAPLVISATLHAGIVFGIPAIQGWAQERPPAPLSSKEPLNDGITKIDGGELNRLIQEKEAYVSSLLSSLRRGKDIQLSGFFIKSEVLDANISRVKKEKPLLNEQQYLERYSSLVLRAKKYVAGKPDKLKALYDFFHKVYVRGYDKEMPGMLDILDTEWGNCKSSTELFSSLTQDVVGIPQNFLLFDDHLASFMRGRRIENTAHTWEESNMPYESCGAILPTDIAIAAYLVQNGVDIDSLPWKLQKFYKKKWNWPESCSRRLPKDKKEFSATASGFPLLGADSGLSVPDEPIPNEERESGKEPLTKKDLLGYAKAIRLVHALSTQKGSLGGTWQAFAPVEVPSDLDWEQFLDQIKGWSIFSRILTYYPKEHRCANKVYSTDELEVLSIMRSLPRYSGVDLEAKLCSKYGPLVLNGSPTAIIMDFPYGFCKDERKVLMERYLSEHWYNLPATAEINQFYINLGFGTMGEYFLALFSNYASKEDFEFFLNEFESRQNEDLRNYASYGMINADFERSCNGILRNPASFSAAISSIVIACHNEEAVWGGFQSSTKEDIRELTFIRGAYISAEQAGSIASFGEGLFSRDEKPVALLKVARILSEYSDGLPSSNLKKYGYSSLSEKFSSKAASLISKGGVELNFIEFSPSHVPLFRALMEDSAYSGQFSQMAACIGAREQFSLETIEMLKSAFASKDWPKMNRITAATILLDLGINPLE